MPSNLALNDPFLRSRAHTITAGGDPLLVGSVRDEAFQGMLGRLVPETREGATGRQAQRAEERLLASSNQSGKSGSGETKQQLGDLRQDALNAILGFSTPVPAGGGGGGGGGREHKPTKKEPKKRYGWVNPKNLQPQATAAPERKEIDPRARALQRALDAMRTTERDLSARRARLNSAPPQLGMSPEFVARMAGSVSQPKFKSGKDAFIQTLFAEQTAARKRGTRENLSMEALQAFHEGDTETAGRLYEAVARKSIQSLGLSGPRAERQMGQHVSKTARAVLSHSGGVDDTEQKFLEANMSPRELERMRDFAASGASEDEMESWTSNNTAWGRRSEQAKLASQNQKTAEVERQTQLMEMLMQMMGGGA